MEYIAIFILVVIIVITIEWIIGTVIGKALSKDAGIIFGIILILLGVTFFIAIPIIIFSGRNKKEQVINININKDSIEKNENKIKKCLQCYKLVINDVMFCPNCGSKYFQFGNKQIKDWKIVFIERNLGKYIDILEKNQLTEIGVFLTLNDSDLEKAGIMDSEDRKKISTLIEYRRQLLN